MNRENLQRAADYIKTIPQEFFDMGEYRMDGSRRSHKCNSIGCVIGHTTILDKYENIPRNEDGWIDFGSWADIFYGLTGGQNSWCFSGIWDDVDNTPIGASKRIQWLLDHGLPQDWKAQMNGESPLCYL